MTLLRGNQHGMTLVETLVTLGVSSVMMLAILEIVTLSQRTTRNVTTAADWNNFTSLVRLALNNEAGCRALLGHTATRPYTFNSATGIFNDPVLGNNKLEKLFYSTSPTNILADTTNAAAYPTFRVTDMDLVKAPGSPPVQQIMDDGTGTKTSKIFWVNQVQLSIRGTKKSLTPSLGGSALTTNVPITVTVISGPAFNADGTPGGGLSTQNDIFSCYVTQSGPEIACEALGGHYLDATQATIPHCEIPEVMVFDPTSSGPPGAPVTGSTAPGAKIQIHSTQGSGGYRNPHHTDFAIGYNDNQMWFNLGGTSRGFADGPSSQAQNAFVWASRPVGTTADGRTDQGVPVMALDSKSMLVLNPEGVFASSAIAFGIGLTSNDTIATPTEKIESNSGLQDLRFTTLGIPRMVIRQDGAVLVGPQDEKTYGRIMFTSDLSSAAVSLDETKWSSIDGYESGGMILRATAPNDSGSPFAARRISLGTNGVTKIHGGLTIDPSKSSEGEQLSAGNVPYACERVLNIQNNYEVLAICPAGKKVTGGGCWANSSLGYTLKQNAPNIGGSGWTCTSTDPGPTYAPIWAYAICCTNVW